MAKKKRSKKRSAHAGRSTPRHSKKAAKKRRTKKARTSRPRPHGRGCMCGAPGCCTAGWKRCRCARCRGRGHAEHTRGPLKNPPSRPARSSRRSAPTRILCERFEGAPSAIRYRRGGQRYEHKFGRGVEILIPKGAPNTIVLKGVRARPFLEG